MTEQDIDRIQNAINHIKTSVDIDPWAIDIAVEAMQEKMEHFADVGKKDDLRESTKKTGDLIDRAEAQIEIMLTAKRYVISAEAQSEGHVLWSAETIDLGSALDALRRVPSAQPEIVRCKDCKWFGDIGCAIRIVDDTDKPSKDDYCSFAERRTDE